MPMTDEERQMLQETNSMVRDIHTSLIGNSQVPGAVPTHSALIKILFKRVRVLEHWRSIIVGMGVLAAALASKVYLK